MEDTVNEMDTVISMARALREACDTIMDLAIQLNLANYPTSTPQAGRVDMLAPVSGCTCHKCGEAAYNNVNYPSTTAANNPIEWSARA